MKFAGLLSSCLLLSAGALLGQEDPGLDRAVLQQIPPRMQGFCKRGVVSGVVTLVARHGQIAKLDAEGMADIEANRPMQKDTIFQIMSMTKPFTCTGIMMLAEEGKLALRDPIDMYLPEFAHQRVSALTGPDSGRLSQPLRPVTIHDLMTHTSGMFDAPPADIRDYNQAMNIPLAELMPVFARQPLLFQPGSHWSYSSPGIDVLGRIIEIVSGEKYEDFISARLLKPLGMKDSFFYPPADRVSRIAMVYAKPHGRLERAPATILGGDPARHREGARYPAPAWGLFSTAEDLAHFYEMMLSSGVYKGRRYLSPFSVGLMTAVQTGDLNPSGWLGGSGYGLGWEVVKDAYGATTGHSIGDYGHGGAFGTQGWIDPKHDLIRVLLIQRSDGGPDTNGMRDVFMTMAEAAVQ